MLKVLQHREKQRAMARKIKFLQGKHNTSSTTMVTIQLGDGSSQDIIGEKEIEDAIMKNNQEKYQQSFHTTFLQTPLCIVRLQIQRTFSCLTSCTRWSLWTIWEHWYVHQDLYWGTLHASSGSKSRQTEHWKKYIDVMIQKKSCMIQLSSLHTICLFPVDYNFTFKYIGREMKRIAESTNSLIPEQYGSRNGHCSIDLAVSKALTYDLLCQLAMMVPGTHRPLLPCNKMVDQGQQLISSFHTRKWETSG